MPCPSIAYTGAKTLGKHRFEYIMFRRAREFILRCAAQFRLMGRLMNPDFQNFWD